MSNGKILSVNVRGIAPEATVNGLLCAVALGRQSGLSSGYEFRTNLELDDSTIFDAPRGAENSLYTIAPTLKQLDPTSVLAASLTIGRRDSPLLKTGRTSAHRETEMISGISAIFGEWWHKLCHLANIARGAEKIEGTSLDVPITKGFDTKSSSGKIAAFYAAVGDLQHYGFNLQENPSVDEVMTAVMIELKPLIGCLDQTSYELGVTGSQSSLGSTTIPQTGEAVELVSTSTWNSFMAAPWRRFMMSPHARNKMIRVLASRMPSVVRGTAGSEEAFMIVEGDDAVVIPASLTTETTADACIEKIGAEIDNARSTGLTEDRYSGASAMTAEHTDQYFLKGDLIQAILKGNVDMVDFTGSSLLSVFPAKPIVGTYNGKDILMFDYETMGTGGLLSLSPITSSVTNWITGRDLYVEDSGYDAFGTMSSGKFTAREVWHHVLPNGVLQMNDPAHCVVSNWKEILTMMNDSMTTDARFLLGTALGSSKADRLKRDLKEAPTAIANGGSVMAEIATYSQLDGIVTSVSASFNPNKVDKPAQQGPVLTDLATGVGPQEVATMATFTRVDPSKEQHFIDLFGGEVQGPKNAKLSSLHVGEAEGKKSPTPLLQKNLPSSKLFGSDNPARDLAEYLQSLPRTLDGTRVLNTTTPPNLHTGISSSKLDNYRFGTGGQAILPSQDPAFSETDYGGYVNIHPGTGFRRGYAQERGHGDAFTRGTVLNVPTSERMDYYKRRAATSATVTLTLTAGSVGVVPLNAGVTQTTRYLGELGASGTAVPCKAAPRSQWITNWGETGLIGNSNYEMFGLLNSFVTLNPSQTSPVSIPNGWISFTDMIRMKPTNTQTVLGEVSLNGAWQAAFAPDLTVKENRAIGVTVQQDFDGGSNLVETGEGLVGAVTVVSPYADRADYVSRKYADDFDATAVNGAGHGGLFGSSDHLFLAGSKTLGTSWGDISTPSTPFPAELRLVYLAPWRRTLAVNNASRRNLINLTTGHGLDHTNDVTVGCTVFDSFGEPTSIQLFDGSNIAPVNGINVVKVQGSGVCKLGSMDYEPFGVLQWVLDSIRLMSDMIIRTPQIVPGIADGPYDFSRSDFSATRSINDDITAQVPSIGVGGNADLNGWLETSGTKIANEINPLNPWFIKAPGKHGDGRPQAVVVQARNPDGEVALTNPWIRPSAGVRGFEVFELNPKDTRTATRSMLADLGKKHDDLTKGLNAENFLVLNERGS